jgi:hypothetical protein
MDEEMRLSPVLLSRQFETLCDSRDKLLGGIYRGTLKIDGFTSLFLSDLLLSSPLRALLKDNIEQK